VLDKIKRNEKAMKSSNPGEMFDFDLLTKLKCTACKGVRYNKARINQLTLLIPVKPTVEAGTPVEFTDCLNKFFGNEIVDLVC
jgi:uncharacterized UBP type Zn finger protein